MWSSFLSQDTGSRFDTHLEVRKHQEWVLFGRHICVNKLEISILIFALKLDQSLIGVIQLDFEFLIFKL